MTGLHDILANPSLQQNIKIKFYRYMVPKFFLSNFSLLMLSASENSWNLKKTSISFFLKKTNFKFFKNFFLFIQNRKLRWQSSIPFLNRQINRCQYIYLTIFNNKTKFVNKNIHFKSNIENKNSSLYHLTQKIRKLNLCSFGTYKLGKAKFKILFKRNLKGICSDLIFVPSGHINLAKPSLEIYNAWKASLVKGNSKIRRFLDVPSKQIPQKFLLFLLQRKENFLCPEATYKLGKAKFRNEETFDTLNFFLFQKFFKFYKEQHENKSHSWIFNKYWLFFSDFIRKYKFSKSEANIKSFDSSFSFFKRKILRKKAHTGYLYLKCFLSKLGFAKFTCPYVPSGLSNLAKPSLDVQKAQRGSQHFIKSFLDFKRLDLPQKQKSCKVYFKTWYLQKYQEKTITFKTNKLNNLFFSKTKKKVRVFNSNFDYSVFPFFVLNLAKKSVYFPREQRTNKEIFFVPSGHISLAKPSLESIWKKNLFLFDILDKM